MRRARPRTILRPFSSRGPTARPANLSPIVSFPETAGEELRGELGSEMLAAVEAAHLLGVEALMIDMDAKTMFDRVWREMPIKERLKLFLSAVTGMFASRKSVENELDNFSENEEAYLKEFGNQFPTLKRVLIDDRNKLMSTRIWKRRPGSATSSRSWERATSTESASCWGTGTSNWCA